MKKQIFDVVITATPEQLAEIHVQEDFSGKTVKAWDWGELDYAELGLAARVDCGYNEKLHYVIPIKYLKKI